jgi:hypothetical protein
MFTMIFISAVIVVVFGAIVAMVLFAARKKFSAEVIRQHGVVVELHRDLSENQIQLLLLNHTSVIESTVCSVFGISEFLEGHEWSDDQYDELPVCFPANDPIKFLIGKYIDDEFLPETVHEELKELYQRIPVVLAHGSRYFVIEEASLSAINNSTRLFTGDATGYESWQQLKEAMHSLKFVTEQWLKEHVIQNELIPGGTS